MIKLLETFFWGLLIACASLIAQVFFATLGEMITGMTIPLHYTQSDTIGHLAIFMSVAATIEELLRYTIIKRKIILYTSTKKGILFHGILLGVGFTTFELLMASFDKIAFSATPFFMFFSVLLIHIFLSIFFLIVAKRKNDIVHDIPFIIIAIIFHVIANLSLFFLFT